MPNWHRVRDTGSARAFVELLQALWTPSKVPAEVAGRVRDLMVHHVLRQRLTPDFSSDASTQPGADALMAQVARTLRDHLRQF